MAKTKKLGKLTNKAIKIAQDRCKFGYFDVEELDRNNGRK